MQKLKTPTRPPDWTPTAPSLRNLHMEARRLYRDGPILKRTLQHWRPYICPFHVLIGLIPPNATVLDIGCGSGLFLGLLAASRRIRYGVGVDANSFAVALGQRMAHRIPPDTHLQLHSARSSDDWPDGTFDAVSLIDVLHHVHPESQRQILTSAAQRVQPGGILIYKDIDAGDKPRALANRLHDMILAREWIHYRPLTWVRIQLEQAGLIYESDGRINMLWYGHQWLIMRAPHIGAVR